MGFAKSRLHMALRQLAHALVSILLISCSDPISREAVSERTDGKLFFQILQSVEENNVELIRKSLLPDMKLTGDLKGALAVGHDYLVQKRLKFVRFSHIKGSLSVKNSSESELTALFLFEPENTDGFVVTLVSRGIEGVAYIKDLKIQEVKGVRLQTDASISGFSSQLLGAAKNHPIAMPFAAISLSLWLGALWASAFGAGLTHRWFWFAVSMLGIGVVHIPSSVSAITYSFALLVIPAVGFEQFWLLRFTFYVVFGGSSDNFYVAGVYCSIPLGAVITLAKWDDLRRERASRNIESERKLGQ